MRFRSFAATLCFTLLACAGARAEVLLNPAVMVKGDIVRMGDLFRDLPAEKAKLPAAYAPRPGERVVFDAERLSDIARAQGIAWQPQSRFERSIVERAGRLIDRDQIASLVTHELARSGVGKGDQIALDNDGLRFYVPVDSQKPIELRDVRFDPQTKRFSGLLVADPTVADALMPISGRVVRMVELPVPARELNRDEVIAKSDVSWVKLAADRLDPNVITDIGELVGRAPRRHLRAGEPVRTGDVRAPVLINRGSLVMMIYQTPYMTISLRGKATQDGAKGDTIRVLNVQSKREIDAVVASADTVVVPSAQARPAN